VEGPQALGDQNDGCAKQNQPARRKTIANTIRRHTHPRNLKRASLDGGRRNGRICGPKGLEISSKITTV